MFILSHLQKICGNSEDKFVQTAQNNRMTFIYRVSGNKIKCQFKILHDYKQKVNDNYL